MDTGDNIGGFNIPTKVSQKEGGADLSNLFDKMQIAVVGRENQEAEDDSGISSDGSSDNEVGTIDEELAY